MFNQLFKKQPLLPEEAIEWLFNGFGWALRSFGSDVFHNETILVEPTRECFPGGGNGVQEMAELIFQRVRHYAGLDHWPCRVVDHHQFDGDPAALPGLQPQGNEEPLVLFYEPQQLTKPDAMIANYAHALAHHLARLAPLQPPCDEDQWPHLTELLAVYFGFGIMFVNTARPAVRAGCGSCGNPLAERSGALDEYEVTYALAIFCALKNIDAKRVIPHIRSYLRPFFKKALKEVNGRTHQLEQLRSIQAPSSLRGRQPASA